MPVVRPSSAEHGATRQPDRSPAVTIRERSRQSQDEPSYRGDDLYADLQEVESQRRDLRPCPGGAAGGKTQLLQQHVGRGGEQDAQLVGAELGAAGAIDRDVEKFLDAVLGLTAQTVDALVDPPRLALEVGDHEASIQARFAIVEANDLGLADDTTLAVPGAGRVAEVGIDVLRFSGVIAQDPGDDQVEFGLALQDLVLRHRHDVVDADRVEELEQFGLGEAAIKADQDARPGEAFLQPTDDPLQERERALLRLCIAGPQRRGAQVLLALAGERQERQQRQVAPGAIEAVEE